MIKNSNKKELVLTDFMELQRQDRKLFSRIYFHLRIIYHALLPRSIICKFWRTDTLFEFSKKEWYCRKVIIKGGHEPNQVLHFFNEARRQGADIFLDIGANFGYYSLMATKTGDFDSIHAFEPHPKIFQLMLLQIRNNKLQNSITPHNIAVSDKDGDMFIDSDKFALNQVSTDEKHATIPIKAVTLDSLFSFTGRNIAIKLDVEGHEISAIKGMEKLLTNNQVLLQVEIWSRKMETLSYLYSIGFQCNYRINEDYYFVNQSLQKQAIRE